MSTLVLVRHGQAKAFSDSPDQLSSVGWEQGRLLGRYWAKVGARFDEAYRGSLRRHRETFEAVASEFRRAGVRFPRATVLPALNEYEAQDLIAEIGPRLAGRDRGFAPLWEDWHRDLLGADRNRRFQRMFEALMARWASGTLDEPSIESWEGFGARVAAGLRQIREKRGRGRRVVAFTSGGPVGIAVQDCLEAPRAAALEVNWRVRNTSLTTFLFSKARVSLDGFNELPHLAEARDLITFR